MVIKISPNLVIYLVLTLGIKIKILWFFAKVVGTIALNSHHGYIESWEVVVANLKDLHLEYYYKKTQPTTVY